MSHIPVMLSEAIEALAPGSGDLVVDGTFGAGGYSRALLEQSSCHVIAFDRDPDAVQRAHELAELYPGRFDIVPGKFGDIEHHLAARNLNTIQGLVLDIGVSSYHVDEAERGFSFMKDGPLDMRMAKTGPTAADAVNFLTEQELANLIYQYGEDRRSRQIAREIVVQRSEHEFASTLELADAIERAVGGRRGQKSHPATRVFQALRIFVNDELGELSRALGAAERLLSAGGRLVVVTFHSLEDRLVKAFLRARSGAEGGGSRHLPQAEQGPPPSFENVKKQKVSKDETQRNPRARSATLRSGVRSDAPPIGQSAIGSNNLPTLSNLEARL